MVRHFKETDASVKVLTFSQLSVGAFFKFCTEDGKVGLEYSMRDDLLIKTRQGFVTISSQSTESYSAPGTLTDYEGYSVHVVEFEFTPESRIRRIR